jgi:methanogenic corrinoid protein MtbC1
VSDAVESLYRSFVDQDPAEAIAVIERARGEGLDREQLFADVFVPATAMLGWAWAESRIDEMAFTQAAVVADQVLSFVTPQAAASDTGVSIVVACIEGEMHAVTRNVIVAALKEAGHRVIDLGIDVQPGSMLEKVEETSAPILVVVAEQMGTAHEVERVTDLLVGTGRGDVVVLVAGGPFVADTALARSVGANGVIRGAESALGLVAAVVRDRLGGDG